MRTNPSHSRLMALPGEEGRNDSGTSRAERGWRPRRPGLALRPGTLRWGPVSGEETTKAGEQRQACSPSVRLSTAHPPAFLDTHVLGAHSAQPPR